MGRCLHDGLTTRRKEPYEVSEWIEKTLLCEKAKVLSRAVEPQRKEGRKEGYLNT
jgi:macrodomain Ter protein organizer (MatP/YcbG family)